MNIYHRVAHAFHTEADSIFKKKKRKKMYHRVAENAEANGAGILLHRRAHFGDAIPALKKKEQILPLVGLFYSILGLFYSQVHFGDAAHEPLVGLFDSILGR